MRGPYCFTDEEMRKMEESREKAREKIKNSRKTRTRSWSDKPNTLEDLLMVGIDDFIRKLEKKAEEMKPTGCEWFLDEARKCITRDRQDKYGRAERNFETISNLWNVYLGDKLKGNLSPNDVGVMMALMKIARIASGTQQTDSYVDAIGYLALAGEIAG